jgi:hydroxypyruvate reductase
MEATGEHGMPARETPGWSRLRDHLRILHGAALAAADPSSAVARTLGFDGECLVIGDRTVGLAPDARIWLIALGKASCGMARAALAVLGARFAGGVIAHSHAIEPGTGWPSGVRLISASHPLPDEGSLRAGEAALDLLRGVADEDVVLVLVSGGGSALFEALRPGVSLPELRRVTDALQRAGADIQELNTVRRAVSRVKGGGLGRAAGFARVVTLALSDVIGDPLEAIASGPTVPSPTGPREALAVLERRGLLDHAPSLTAALGEAAAVVTSEPVAERIVRVVGSNRIAAEALCAEAGRAGFRTLLLTDRLQGEAREVGRLVGGIAVGMRVSGLPLPAPACVVLGGETTVTLRGDGRGGRNLELALGAAHAIEGCPRVAVFSFATDGMDGSSGAAGAVVTGETLARAGATGLDATQALADNDTEPFFRALGDLWQTGPSGTNVNDLVVVLAYP